MRCTNFCMPTRCQCVQQGERCEFPHLVQDYWTPIPRNSAAHSVELTLNRETINWHRLRVLSRQMWKRWQEHIITYRSFHVLYWLFLYPITVAHRYGFRVKVRGSFACGIEKIVVMEPDWCTIDSLIESGRLLSWPAAVRIMQEQFCIVNPICIFRESCVIAWCSNRSNWKIEY
jgi:hypothetical protein